MGTTSSGTDCRHIASTRVSTFLTPAQCQSQTPHSSPRAAQACSKAGAALAGCCPSTYRRMHARMAPQARSCSATQAAGEGHSPSCVSHSTATEPAKQEVRQGGVGPLPGVLGNAAGATAQLLQDAVHPASLLLLIQRLQHARHQGAAAYSLPAFRLMLLCLRQRTLLPVMLFSKSTKLCTTTHSVAYGLTEVRWAA